MESYNGAVDAVVESGLLERVLVAQTEISFSNSLIEAWWRALKHRWLYLNALGSVSEVRSLVAYYVEQHNECIPHSAFRGQTPDEMYFGTGTKIPAALDQARLLAREERLEVNRAKRCGVCA